MPETWARVNALRSYLYRQKLIRIAVCPCSGGQGPVPGPPRALKALNTDSGVPKSQQSLKWQPLDKLPHSLWKLCPKMINCWDLLGGRPFSEWVVMRLPLL